MQPYRTEPAQPVSADERALLERLHRLKASDRLIVLIASMAVVTAGLIGGFLSVVVAMAIGMVLAGLF